MTRPALDLTTTAGRERLALLRLGRPDVASDDAVRRFGALHGSKSRPAPRWRLRSVSGLPPVRVESRHIPLPR